MSFLDILLETTDFDQGKTLTDRTQSRRVLQDLSRAVGGMADATENESRILGQIEAGERTYLQLAEKILTRANDLPIGMDPALETLGQLGGHLEGMSGAVADQQSGRARELAQVTSKEQEEKEEGGGGDEDPDDSTGTDDSSDDSGEEGGDGGQGDGGGTTTGPDSEEEIPECDPPDDDGSEGDGSIPPTGGGTQPGDDDPDTPGDTDPPETPPTEIPEFGDGDCVVVAKRTRRCFKFRLHNTTNRPVSDLHFDGDDLSMVSTSVGSEGGVQGWSGFNVTGGKGLLFKVDANAPPVPPGGRTDHFEFCSESNPRGFDIRMTHPAGPPTTIGPGGISVGGKPARRRNGKTLIPPDKVTTHYDVEITVTEDGKKLQVEANGKMESGTVSDRTDPYDAWIPKDDPRHIAIGSVPGPAGFQTGDTVHVTVVSSSANLKFRVKN